MCDDLQRKTAHAKRTGRRVASPRPRGAHPGHKRAG
jgi:hypothetical protein